MTGRDEFRRADLRAFELLGQAKALVGPDYWLLFGICAVGFILGSLVPFGIIMGPMMCGIYMTYRAKERGQPLEFGMLFKGFDKFVDSLIATLIMLGLSLVLIVPVVLKSRLKVDEVVTTLLLNFIILLLVSYLVEGPWRDPMLLGWPQAEPIIDQGVLPKLVAKTRLHLGLFVALGAAVVVWLVINFTVWGHEIRAVGHNARAAAFAGIRVDRTIVVTALLSGGLAGMAGVTEVAGLKGYLTLDMSPGFGYAGIAIAMLAQLHPLGVIAAALFLSAIYVGADSMSRAVNIPTYIADVLVATSLLAVLLSVTLTRFRVRLGWARGHG